MKGKIVLIPFPFTDLTAYKLRPALVLHEGERDVVVAFISSRIREELRSPEILVDRAHPEFDVTGLKTPSIIRLDKVATVMKNLVLGEIGEIGDRLKGEINRKISQVYGFPP